MDKDKEIIRLRRLALVSILFIIFIFIALIIFGTWQLKNYDHISQIQTETAAKVNKLEEKLSNLKLQKGDNGLSIKGDRGEKGDSIPGPKGNDSVSTERVLLQPIFTNIPVPGPKGDVGDMGPRGFPGRSVFQRDNPETGAAECRYAGDSEWQPAENCN